MTTTLRPELEELLRERATATALAAAVAPDHEPDVPAASPAPGRDAPAPDARRPATRRWRRPAIGLGGLAAAGAGAVAVVLFAGGDHLSPLAEARAALGAPDEILHFRVVPFAYSNAQPDGPRCTLASPIEVWQPTDGSPRLHFRRPPMAGSDCGPVGTTADGVPAVGVNDTAIDGGIETDYVAELGHAVHVDYGPHNQVPRLDLLNFRGSGFSTDKSVNDDPQLALRDLLARPGIRIGGETTQDGRLVRSFVVTEPKFDDSDPSKPNGGTITYVVDAKTFAPVSISETASRAYDRGKYIEATSGMRFVSWERLPLDAAHEPLLSIQLPVGTTQVSGTAEHFYQASRAVRLRRERDGQALLEAYQQRTGKTG